MLAFSAAWPGLAIGLAANVARHLFSVVACLFSWLRLIVIVIVVIAIANQCNSCAFCEILACVFLCVPVAPAVEACVCQVLPFTRLTQDGIKKAESAFASRKVGHYPRRERKPYAEKGRHSEGARTDSPH